MAIRYSFGSEQFYGRGQKQWQKRRTDFPGTMALRVDDLYMIEEPEGVVPTAVWGTSLCSGERVFMRLATEDEEREDSGRSPASGRRSIEELCAACPSIGRASELAPEYRPVLRCDRVRPCLTGSGEPALHVRYDDQEDKPWAAMRCSWITPYGPYTTRSGEQINPREHMETWRYSTVNLSLAGSRQDRASYYGMYADYLKRAAATGESRFARICAAVSEELVTAWEQEREHNPRARLGSMSLTTWYPEESFRFELEDRQHFGRRSLISWLSDESFALRVRDEAAGQFVPGSVTPECVLRFLDRQGEVCGVYRVRSHILASLPGWAARRNRTEEPGFWLTPQGRAAFLLKELVQGLDQDFVEQHGAESVDILPGRTYRMDMGLTAPETAPGRGIVSKAARFRLKNMVCLGLLHGHSPLGERRQNLGCAQAFVPRTAGEYVLGWYSLRDGSPYHNACLLMPEGESLQPSAAYAEELKHEQNCLSNICLCPSLQPDADPDAREGADEGQGPVVEEAFIEDTDADGRLAEEEGLPGISVFRR